LASPQLLARDFYISDFVLPGRNGLQLLDEIQKRSGRAIKGILMTGETSPGRMELALASRWKILLKPTGLASLLSAMSDVASGVDGVEPPGNCRE